MNNLGKFLKKLRVENEEYLKDMATKAGVSISFLSAVENEIKIPSEKLISNIITNYKLTDEQQEEFRKFCAEASKEVSINLENLDKDKVDLAYRFARQIGEMSDDELNQIRSILNERKGDK